MKSMWSKVKQRVVEINTGGFEVFEATRQAMDEVMNALNDDKVTAVGVYGMGGVGKTIMVEHVSQQAQNTGLFDHVIMVVVTQSPDLRKIQGMLADQLGVGLQETTVRKIQGTLANQFGTFADQFGIKLEESTQSSRAARLSKEIMRRNKILIILDDIWERIDLSRIGIPSYKELQNCNSKVLLTTRIRNVCHVMGCQENITLSTLSEEDSWTLFVRNAGRFSESTKFEDVARKVARECAGLPIAVIKVARALGNKFLAEWKEAAQRLEKSQTANPDHGEDAFRCIKLSYDYLKEEDSKSCFLLCCLFPEDYDIPIEDLFKYAIGKGFFRRAKTIEEARGTADSVVRYLKDSSLLLDSEKKGCVRMHDVIRDTALNIAKSEDGHGFLVKAGCGLQDWPRQLHEGYSAVSLMENDISKLPEEELVCPKLKILLLQGNNHLEEIPEAFFQSSNALMVLDLSHTSITSLPQSFSLLTNLQALYFESCPMIDFSNLRTLKKLEILSMRGNVIRELSREIGNLTNLRMLDITGGLIGKIPPKVISDGAVKLRKKEKKLLAFMR
ncbi:putative P-loop containing nucleoside triphosphate hydrolase, leucine-rich repeat domain, L [Rosa chinensis]|uniref:Putative P-loop containing nucleoside triphosphate hydrolase, leucine-rich repeat domain, L n=1 Tax=Rosa chinensis TaxID=74649 RepID=A0A2P6QMP3_ROSCH|nr:putative P-loop containing nucleoside triphosphate hydrolase, leucine-rich repeat domain, L [Rosa chinensis]